MSFPKTAGLLLVIIAGVLVSLHGSAPDAQDKNLSEEFAIPPEVKGLLEQRLRILRQMELSIVKLRDVGRATAVEVLASKRERPAAEIDLAESRDARLEILRQQVEAARSAEAIVQRIADMKRASQSDVLRIRLDRLAAEIDLAREMRKAGRREF